MFEISDDEFETLQTLLYLKDSLLPNSVKQDKIEEMQSVLMSLKQFERCLQLIRRDTIEFMIERGLMNNILQQTSRNHSTGRHYDYQSHKEKVDPDKIDFYRARTFAVT